MRGRGGNARMPWLSLSSAQAATQRHLDSRPLQPPPGSALWKWREVTSSHCAPCPCPPPATPVRSHVRGLLPIALATVSGCPLRVSQTTLLDTPHPSPPPHPTPPRLSQRICGALLRSVKSLWYRWVAQVRLVSKKPESRL